MLLNLLYLFLMESHHRNLFSKLLQIIPGNSLSLPIGRGYIGKPWIGSIAKYSISQKVVYRHHSLAKASVAYNYAPPLIAKPFVQICLKLTRAIWYFYFHGTACE